MHCSNSCLFWAWLQLFLFVFLCKNVRSWMICCMNILMTFCRWNTWIFFNQWRMTADYDSNADSWFDFLIMFCKSQMRNNSEQKTSRMTYQKDDTPIVAVHRCTLIEANLNALNWTSYHSNRLNDCIQWAIFNHLTHIFNQLQRRIARSWRIQNAIEQHCENHQKSDKQKERWNRAKRRRKKVWLYIIM